MDVTNYWNNEYWVIVFAVLRWSVYIYIHYTKEFRNWLKWMWLVLFTAVNIFYLFLCLFIFLFCTHRLTDLWQTDLWEHQIIHILYIYKTFVSLAWCILITFFFYCFDQNASNNTEILYYGKQTPIQWITHIHFSMNINKA